MPKIRILLYLYSIIPLGVWAQQGNYFIAPLNIKLNLAGNFGEIRPNHFHSGIDIKTNQRVGYPVMAVADGFVSRLRVQEGGFGYAVYISHPNGITSVYAHLSKFSPIIARLVKNYQYQNKTYEADFKLTPIEIPLKQGDNIGYSGNSGSSVAPHLHFETRDSQTEEIINPLTLGFAVADNVKPTINALYVYQLGKAPFSDNTAKQAFAVRGSKGIYTLAHNHVLSINGQVGLGIATADKFTGNSNKNGIYATTIFVDDIMIYQTEVKKFSFETSRSVNSYIDYPLLLKSGITVQKTFAAPGIKPSFFTCLINEGKINLNDSQIHEVKCSIKDYAGNSSEFRFKIKQASNSKTIQPASALAKTIKYNTDYEIITPNFKLYIPKFTLYDDVNFLISTTPKPKGVYSDIYRIHNKLTPLHGTFNVWLKPDSALKKLNKAVVISTDGKCQGGEVDNGFIKASIKKFGNYCLAIDTLAPYIIPLGKYSNRTLLAKLQFKIGDNLSGIKLYNGYINNQWVLMEYESKTGTLTHLFDERTGFGKHSFKLIVTDKQENTKEYNTVFYR
jgi:hypothetical protein